MTLGDEFLGAAGDKINELGVEELNYFWIEKYMEYSPNKRQKVLWKLPAFANGRNNINSARGSAASPALCCQSKREELSWLSASTSNSPMYSVHNVN